jgi:CDP-glucose 4,6-dehydratase
VGELLQSGAHVIGLIRDADPRSQLYRSGNAHRIVQVSGSLTDPGLIDRVLVKYEVDVVFHLGAQTQVRHAQRLPLETLESNVRGTYLLLEAVRTLSRPVDALVVASSDKAYGDSELLPYVESHPLRGRNIYDASKSAADLLASAYAHSFGLPLAVARCGNIYGGGDLNWDRLVPGTIRSLLLGDRPLMRSDGSPKRDYLFVDDAVAAYLTLASHVATDGLVGDAFNFGAEQPVAVREVVAAIGTIMGREDLAPVVMADAPNEIAAQWLDSRKARERLGWNPAVPLREGLARSVEWYREALA